MRVACARSCKAGTGGPKLSSRWLILLALVLSGQPAQSDETSALLAQLQSIQNAHDTPAFAIAIVDKTGPLHVGSYGEIDRSSGRLADSNTRFRIGSITKTITALTTLIAVEQGALALDSPFIKRADATLIDNPWRGQTPVTIEQLLEHTAGLKGLTHEEMYHSDSSPLALSEAIHRFAKNRRLAWYPGEHYSYTNAGSGLVAYAVQQATGMEFEAYAHNHLLKPLAMDTATWRLNEATRADLAVGYDDDGRTEIPYWHMLFRPFGALNARPHDMSRLLLLLLNDGVIEDRRILPAAAMQRLRTPKTSLAARAGLELGYALGLYSWFSHGLKFYGHGGDGDGYLSHLGFSLETGRGYFLVINAFTPAPLRAMRDAVESFVAAGSEAPTMPFGSAQVDASALGKYVPATSRFGDVAARPTPALKLLKDESGLLLETTDGRRQRLISAGATLWRRRDEPGPSAALIRDREGRWTFYTDRIGYRQWLAPAEQSK